MEEEEEEEKDERLPCVWYLVHEVGLTLGNPVSGGWGMEGAIAACAVMLYLLPVGSE